MLTRFLGSCSVPSNLTLRLPRRSTHLSYQWRTLNFPKFESGFRGICNRGWRPVKRSSALWGRNRMKNGQNVRGPLSFCNPYRHRNQTSDSPGSMGRSPPELPVKYPLRLIHKRKIRATAPQGGQFCPGSGDHPRRVANLKSTVDPNGQKAPTYKFMLAEKEATRLSRGLAPCSLSLRIGFLVVPRGW